MKQRPTPAQPCIATPDISFARLREVEKFSGLKRSTLYRMMDAGLFPRQMRIGQYRAVGWRRSDLEAWANSRPISDNRSPRQRGSA